MFKCCNAERATSRCGIGNRRFPGISNIDTTDDGLSAEIAAERRQKVCVSGRGAYDEFLDANLCERLAPADIAQSTPIGQRDETLRREFLEKPAVGLAPIDRCVDVEDDDFVDFFFVEQADDVERVTDVRALAEGDRFHQASAPVECQNGNELRAHGL